MKTLRFSLETLDHIIEKAFDFYNPLESIIASQQKRNIRNRIGAPFIKKKRSVPRGKMKKVFVVYILSRNLKTLLSRKSDQSFRAVETKKLMMN